MSGAGGAGGAGGEWRGAWRAAHALSLDVALGAAGVSGAVARAWGAAQPPAVALAAAAAALLIYSVDHLLDLRARLAAARPLSPRRRAHRRLRPALRALALLSALGGLALLPALPPPTLALGLALGALCAGYLWWAQGAQGGAQGGARGRARAALKPRLVSLGYALGVSLAGVSARLGGAPAPPLALDAPPPLWVGAAASALAWLCAALNVALLARHERGGAGGAGAGLAALALLSAPLALWLSPQRLAPLALVACALAALWGRPAWAGGADRYRLLGDGALLLAWVHVAV
ncbi:MAG: hypothetical protein FJ138_15940 [Deltaproteobacteria bacterium]|nr:hypothetical protein [Deltaproteobacteria bacterium]